MDQAREADVGDVAGGGEDAFEVPDCLGSISVIESAQMPDLNTIIAKTYA